MKINIDQLMIASGVQFGTSGVRGLVKDMTDKVCFAYVTGFLQYLQAEQLITTGSKVGIAGDLRSSSPQIMNAAAAACIELGFEPVNYGFIPSPAIALFGLHQKIPTIMVTGSHIPDDRNGIKFNTPAGELLKQDEQAVKLQQVDILENLFSAEDKLLQLSCLPIICKEAEEHYIQRFIDFLPADCLQGKHIGLYEHSSVSRDCLKTILQQLGAQVTSLGRSEKFVSVDTEAIRPQDISLAKQWAQQHKFDCIISTDGDGDRPLVSDEKGNWLRGDIAGVLCANYFNANIVVTPISSNTVVDKMGFSEQVIRTKIGSPYVINAMQQASENNTKIVVGYEANGGFLQQTLIQQNEKILSPLPTRDAVIVPLTILLLAQQRKRTISELLNDLPQRYTYSDRLKDFPTEVSRRILSTMMTGNIESDLATFKNQFPDLTKPILIDTTDGIRITLENSEIVHFRPSGNAPELRCYTEANNEGRAKELNELCLTIMKGWC